MSMQPVGYYDMEEYSMLSIARGPGPVASIQPSCMTGHKHNETLSHKRNAEKEKEKEISLEK